MERDFPCCEPQYIEGSTLLDFEVGDRVKFHPASDLFVQGHTYGDVVKVGRMFVHVRSRERTVKVWPFNLLLRIVDHDDADRP